MIKLIKGTGEERVFGKWMPLCGPVPLYSPVNATHILALLAHRPLFSKVRSNQKCYRGTDMIPTHY